MKPSASSEAPQRNTTKDGISQPKGEGISQEKLKQLCKCNDRIFPKIRDDPEKLAEFTLKRTGLVYEYRKGKYYPK